MKQTENSAFTKDGRFFVIGGDTLFEIVKGEDGSYQNIPYLTLPQMGDSSIFSGLTSNGNKLYAAYSIFIIMQVPGYPTPMPVPVSAIIYQLDTTKVFNDPSRVQFAHLIRHQVILANGMVLLGHIQMDKQAHILIVLLHLIVMKK